ncbi:MAG: hypothetical protein KME12_18025 [Trichocoleus desertorum ATA4-8-CV12]|jgi:hypothetical protein|nr:hypothetical protein [Trichocoleus desertorum ATA4-8-CV12]
MSEPNPLEGFLDQVLSDPSLKDELSEGDRMAMKTLFGNLLAGVPGAAATSASTTESGLPVDINTLMQEIRWEDGIFDDVLDQKSDAALMQCLVEQIKTATRVVNLLGQRSIGRGAVPEIGHLELQLTAVGLGIADLQQALARQTPLFRLNPSWQQRLRNLLLHEFHFINRWFGSKS